MNCPEDIRLAAWFDGELDGEDAREIAAHAANCERCQRQMAELTALRSGMRAATFHHASADLRARIVRASAAAETADIWQRPQEFLGARAGFWLGAGSGACASALAALAAAFFLSGPGDLADMVASAHLRALQPGHLADISSSDPAVVARWLQGHAPVAPPVADLGPQFRLAGARADYIYDRPATAIVYRLNGRAIDLIAWPDDGRSLPREASEDGIHIRFWRQGGLIYCAASRVASREVERFSALAQGRRE